MRPDRLNPVTVHTQYAVLLHTIAASGQEAASLIGGQITAMNIDYLVSRFAPMLHSLSFGSIQIEIGIGNPEPWNLFLDVVT